MAAFAKSWRRGSGAHSQIVPPRPVSGNPDIGADIAE
jgi:hypothetical protein